ncbi:hypothetical protein CC86DRAFT_426106 [Ophiobolus disseminans]|uniref:Uncharacterized protein n=1 Tax=Ophiobolus disseminans TaxID=1469910 RepID=A0A6A6ZKY3_9PLEO|nr:hypothetical protein CC86DRAFT_426106 [Ophiobolus disseminans]
MPPIPLLTETAYDQATQTLQASTDAPTSLQYSPRLTNQFSNLSCDPIAPERARYLGSYLSLLTARKYHAKTPPDNEVDEVLLILRSVKYNFEWGYVTALRHEHGRDAVIFERSVEADKGKADLAFLERLEGEARGYLGIEVVEEEEEESGVEQEGKKDVGE